LNNKCLDLCRKFVQIFKKRAEILGKTSARFLKMCRRFIANVSLFLLDVWGRDENHEVKALNRATVHRLNIDKNN